MLFNRVLFSAGIPCKNGCAYCFSQFNNENIPIINYEKVKDLSYHIIYPSCDGEIYLNENLISFFNQYLQKATQYNIFSFSTKKVLSSDELDFLESTNNQLKSKQIGELKISISVTTKNLIESIEPHSAPYHSRLDLASQLLRRKFLTSLILKPILPFVSLSEYCNIIDDFATIGIHSFITGDLYIDLNSSFYQKYIRNTQCQIEQKPISWLPQHPIWTTIKSNLREKVISYIKKNDLCHFESDIDFINDKKDGEL